MRCSLLVLHRCLIKTERLLPKKPYFTRVLGIFAVVNSVLPCSFSNHRPLCILSRFSETLKFLWIYKEITSHLNTNGSESKGDSFSPLLFFEPTTYAAICSSMVIPPFKTITSFPSGITRIHSMSLRTTISLYSEKLISVSARNALILSIS